MAQPQQEGLDSYKCKEQYFDIMLVGMTGQGKSTTADKLLIANPGKVKYEMPDKMIESRDGMGGSGGQQSVRVKIEDISMWLLHSEDESAESETHLKGLLYSRASEEPHDKINKMRDPKNKVLAATSSCQVLSNDTTKIRILDVPGFEDGRAFKPTQEHHLGGAQSSSKLQNMASNITFFNFNITRNIIRIQAALGMCFRRVVYFLPTRGPLERSSALLKSELQHLEYVFGRSIFECMVVVATISRRYSLKPESDEEKFPGEDVEQCDEHFQMALRDVFINAGHEEDVPKVPIIFLSLSESCESILRKIQGARVSRDRLELRFNPNACINCGIRIGSIKMEDKEEKVTCSFPHDPDLSIPYEESKCHPVFKRSILSHLLGRNIAKKIAKKWPSYKEEYCAGCEALPFEPGCLKVGQKYKTWWGKVYPVDHTSELADPVEEPDQSGAGSGPDGSLPVSLPPPPPGSSEGQSVTRADRVGLQAQRRQHVQLPPPDEPRKGT